MAETQGSTDNHDLAQNEPARFSSGDFVSLVSSIALAVAFFLMPWVYLQGDAMTGTSLLAETRPIVGADPTIWLVLLALVMGLVAGVAGMSEPKARLFSKRTGLVGGLLGLIYFVLFFVGHLQNFSESIGVMGAGFWIALLAAIALVVQTVIPRPAASKVSQKIWQDLFTRRVGKIGLLVEPIFGYFFLWAPILLLVIFSFNDSRSVASWHGFTLQWYNNIFNNLVGGDARFSTDLMLNSLGNSLLVAFVATTIATTIGTTVALSLVRGNYPGKQIIDGLLFLPVVIPEITQAISLLIFFNVLFDFIGTTTGARVDPGFGTIIIGHVAFNISYVAIVVRARLADMNPRYEEAARDLGANEWRTFWRITFPLILPGIVSGALLAFTLSLDDFVITFFNSGPGTTTLPVFVYGLLKLTVTPEINAISTLILLASTILIGISIALQGRNATAAA